MSVEREASMLFETIYFDKKFRVNGFKMLQIILVTPSETSVNMVGINFIFPHLTHGNVSLKIQM